MARRGLSLTARIFLSTAAVVAAVLGVTLYFTSREAGRTADATVDRSLMQATDQISTQLDARRRALQGQAEIFAAEPNFRSLVQSKTRLADLLDQAIEAQERIGADWTQITDENGVLLAKSDEPGAEPRDLTGSALIAGALAGTPTAGYGRSAAGGLLQTVAVPVTQPAGAQVTVLGVLMGARAVDSAFARSVKAASPDSIDVAFFVLDSAGPRVVASTIAVGDDLTPLIGSMPWPADSAAPDTTGRRDSTAVRPVMRALTHMDGAEYVAFGAPLRTASGTLVGGVVVFRNRDAEFAPFRRLEQTIALWGGIGLALAAVLAFGVARQITRPVLALVAATRRAAEGDYAADISVKASGEIGTLADAFARMLSDLREKQALVEFLSVGQADARTVAMSAAPTMAMTLQGGGMAPGHTFAQRYEVKEMLGAGGMGMVFKAVDTELGEVIAIKTLRPEMLGEDPNALERFKSEIRLARRISHRNVVRTHDLGESGGVYFITMEFVEGRSLKELIQSRGRLPVPVALSVAKQLCRALEVAHDAGVIHRDIKPQNMVVQGDGVLKVMDFGIARLARRKESVTQQGMVVGTPEYMAPEQLMGDEIDARADLYAAGCVLYECVTGKTPITADTPITLIARVLEDVPLEPRVVNGEVPEALSAIIMQLLAKKAEERPKSAADLHRALEAVG